METIAVRTRENAQLIDITREIVYSYDMESIIQTLNSMIRCHLTPAGADAGVRSAQLIR